MKCQNCASDRVASINAKCSDMCFIQINDKESEGYIPHDMNIGSGDYINFKMCLECGQVQGKFPLKLSELESE